MSRSKSRVRMQATSRPSKRHRKPVSEGKPAASDAKAASATAPAAPGPFAVPRHVPTLEELFGGPRPASFSRGLEPAFLLIDREVMEQLRTRAMALGLGGYDSLVKRILREHVHEY